MKSDVTKSGSNEIQRAENRCRTVGFSKCAVAVIALLGTATARAAIIAPITLNDVPLSDPTSVFDASHAGNTYSLESGSAFIPAGFDVRDLFGGSFGTFGPEQNDVLFEDNQPIGTIESVDVTLASPVSLSSFSLFMEDDGSGGQRSCREFMIYSNGQMIDDISLLDFSGTQDYTGVYGSNYLQISDSFSDLAPSADYTLEFVQNNPAAGDSGMRALEFEATGATTAPAAAVPEPLSVSGLLLGIAGCLMRRRQGLHK